MEVEEELRRRKRTSMQGDSASILLIIIIKYCNIVYNPERYTGMALLYVEWTA